MVWIIVQLNSLSAHPAHTAVHTSSLAWGLVRTWLSYGKANEHDSVRHLQCVFSSLDLCLCVLGAATVPSARDSEQTYTEQT